MDMKMYAIVYVYYFNHFGAISKCSSMHCVMVKCEKQISIAASEKKLFLLLW
jgi:hypothetical protein